MTLHNPLFSDRSAWMSVLATAPAMFLSDRWETMPARPDFGWVREPQFETVMLRARADAAGECFNLGEMTVTRCSVKLADGPVGVACIGGRDKRHAAIAAVIDAMMQMPAGDLRRQAAEDVVLAAYHADRAVQAATSAKVRETEVSFSMSIAGVRT